MNQFLTELRRRNMFRVAAAYLVVGWMLIQVVTLIEAPLSLPTWTDTLVIVLLGLSFPVAMLLAWAFEMTPEGMQKTTRAEGDVKFRPLGGTDFVLIGLMVVVLGMIGFQILRDGPAPVVQPIAQTPRGETSVSIAVLPFVDLSEDGDQEYFSDGISEEILNVLVRIPELGVAGRTSSFAFKNQNQDLRIIGEALGVNHVLEGSVRRSGDRLRITAQLIRASDGFHIWSETYDRDLIDIFAIQDEIALAVSEQLAVSLGLSRESLSRSTTSNIQAYESYLRARPLFFARGVDNLEQALVLLSHATALDPNFAPAWETMAGVYSVMASYAVGTEFEYVQQWRSAGQAAADRAISLAPNSAEAHAYLGVIKANALDWISAFESLDRAIELAPNDPAVLDAVAQRFADVGYSAQAMEYSQRAVQIEPLVAVYRNTLAWTHLNIGQGDIEVALAQHRAGIEIDPTLAYLHNNLMDELIADGRLEEASAALERAHAAGGYPEDIYLARRRINDAWASGESALRAAAESLGPNGAFYVGIILDDLDLILDSFVAYQSLPVRNDLLYYIPYRGDYQSDPRWKAQVVRDGVLDLWRARGFPETCQPVGDDDFECDWRPAQ
jgi:TolB-like protein/Tfp pilus assembly protein PilF